MSNISPRAEQIAARVEAFVRQTIIPYEQDPRRSSHGPADSLVDEMRSRARAAGVLTPHILPDGSHLTQRETAHVLKKTGLSPLGPLACNTAAPDEGNMYLLGKVGSPEQKKRFLEPLVQGDARSAFFMTEPAEEGGAGSDPSMMQSTAVQERQSLGDQRPQGLHHRRRRRQGRHRHGEVGRGRLHVPRRSAQSRDPHRARARHHRLIDAGRPCGGRRSTTCACPPTRCSARAARASSMRRCA